MDRVDEGGWMERRRWALAGREKGSVWRVCLLVANGGEGGVRHGWKRGRF